jgi:hypothetical protein
MKRLFVFAFISALLVGCATTPPDATSYPASSQDATGVPIDPSYRAPRASVGIGIGSWGGRGFGGVGIGLGF